jgi:transposase
MTALQTLTTPAFHPGPMADRPDPEVPERARRRTFTTRYKLAVLAEYHAAEPGAKGAILRREGLYSSHLVDWRRQRDAGALAGLSQARGRRPADARETEIARLRTEKAKLEAELAKAQFVIDVQGKLQALWSGRLSPRARPPTTRCRPTHPARAGDRRGDRRAEDDPLIVEVGGDLQAHCTVRP